MAYAPQTYRVTYYDVDCKILAETDEVFESLHQMMMELPERVKQNDAWTAECPLKPTGLYLWASRVGARIDNRCDDIYVRHGCK